MPTNLEIHGRDPVYVWPRPRISRVFLFLIFGSKSEAAGDWAQDNTLSDIITISSSDKIGREINDFIAVQAENLSWWPDLQNVFAKTHSESKLFIRSLDTDSLCGVFSSARRPCHHVINM